LSRTVADSSTSGDSSSSIFGGNSTSTSTHAGHSVPTLPAVKRSLALAVALAELYASGLPLDGASIAAGIVAEAVDVSALHINTVQAKLGPEVAALVHDVLAVRHAPERAQSYDDASSR
jgi:(p)ppGpp synthase/HD superfamily hydrolase